MDKPTATTCKMMNMGSWFTTIHNWIDSSHSRVRNHEVAKESIAGRGKAKGSEKDSCDNIAG